jgi:type II secretory pathway component GspD/PulD (secretin)
MKFLFSHHALLSLATIIAPIPFATLAQAQAPRSTVIIKNNTHQLQYIRVRNLMPSMMAWWLDPKRHPEPQQYLMSRRNLELSSAFVSNARGARSATSPNIKQEGSIGLPEGVEFVVPQDEQNTLMVYGTTEGLAQLQDVVSFLDRPLRQIEVTTKLVEMSAKTAGELGWIARDQAVAPTPQAENVSLVKNEKVSLIFAQNNIHSRIQALVAEKKANVRKGLGIAAINNLTARLGMTIAQPAALGVKEGDNFKPLLDPESATTPFYLTTTSSLSATPTINNDGTITLLLQPSKDLRISREPAGHSIEENSIFVKRLAGVQSVVNIKDGQTIILHGLPRTLFAPDNRLPLDSTPFADNQVFLLVTARIVPRAGDDVPRN